MKSFGSQLEVSSMQRVLYYRTDFFQLNQENIRKFSSDRLGVLKLFALIVIIINLNRFDNVDS